MTDHQREKLEKLIQRQIEADRDSDPFAFFSEVLCLRLVLACWFALQ